MKMQRGYRAVAGVTSYVTLLINVASCVLFYMVEITSKLYRHMLSQKYLKPEGVEINDGWKIIFLIPFEAINVVNYLRIIIY